MMNFEEDRALAVYQRAIADLEAFRPTYDQAVAQEPIGDFNELRVPEARDDEVHHRWRDLQLAVDNARAELDRVRAG